MTRSLSNASTLLTVVALAYLKGTSGATAAGKDTAPIRIQAPANGSVSRSGFVGLEGTAPPATRLEILDAGETITKLESGADGHFDAVLQPRPGRLKLQVRVAGDSEYTSAQISVRVDDHGGPAVTGLYENLREGDIVLSRDLSSLQVSIYDPHYTHASLFLGPDWDGTPVMLEPVTNQASASYGVIAAIPIEESLAWMRAQTGIYRLKRGLRPVERDRLLAWGRKVANREVSFWSVTHDFGALYRTWLMWDFQKDRPRDEADFEHQIATLRARLKAIDRFDCVTLVWRAYYEATQGHVDLTTPNRATFDGAGRSVTPRFLARIKPVLITPDTLALNDNLVRVAGR